MKSGYFLFGLLVLFSCAGAPPIRYFTVDFQSTQKNDPKNRQVLYIQPFTGTQMYEQDRMIYKPSTHEITFDHYRRWISSPVVLMRQKSVDVIRGAGLFDRVCTELTDVPECLVLECRITRFEEVNLGTGHEMQAGLWVEISKWPGNRLLWQGELEGRTAVENISTEGIVKAMSKATERVLEQLVSTLKTVTRER
ncbi:hypothetical protein JW935_17740 [candidate division KSB1 bacterium]|nr:hypothetical protein [candidate division KSB1 bacterium]